MKKLLNFLRNYFDILFTTLGIIVLFTDEDGPGDRPFDFVLFKYALAGAAALAVAWTILEPRFRWSWRVNIVLRWFITTFLAYIILTYGAAKIMGMQFGHNYSAYERPLGSLRPMQFAWAFFGASYAFQAIIGWSQVLASVLLLFRTTRNLGAIILVPIMLNIVLVNFYFDVSVKLFSSYYLAMAIYILLWDFRRLTQFFFANQTVLPAPATPFFGTKQWRKVAQTAGWLLAVFVVLYPFYDTYQAKKEYHLDVTYPMEGGWTIQQITWQNDSLNLRMQADSTRWNTLCFERGQWGSINTIKKGIYFFNYEADMTAQRLDLTINGQDSLIISSAYQLNSGKDTLIMEGTMGQDSFSLKAGRKKYRLIGN